MNYHLRPIYRDNAIAFVGAHHRHNPGKIGWLFGTSACSPAGEIFGVIMIGRTGPRGAHSLCTAEFRRVCVREDAPAVACRRGDRHANSIASLLMSAGWRACRALGFTRIITYLRLDEPATTLAALRHQGWKLTAKVKGRSWDCASRPREDKHEVIDRQRWEWVADSDARPARKGAA